MKVICTQENLRTGLQLVGRVISPSNSLPILNNVLIKTQDGVLKVSSTNLELAITTSIRCKTEEEGEVTVFAKTITDLVNNLPSKNVTLETKNGEMAVDAENYHTTVKTLPADEFPLIPEIDGKNQLTVDAQKLKTALSQVLFAVSTNQTQPEISGVLFALHKDVLKIVATDRYRLGEKLTKLKTTPGFDVDLIIPHKTVAEVIRVIGGYEGEVEINVNDTQIAFTVDQTQIISRLIDGQYPPYQAIIPTSFTTVVTTQRQALVNALKAGSVFSQSNNSITFEYSAGAGVLKVLAEAQELGKSAAELPAQVEGEDGLIILNHRYVLDCLNAIEEDQIKLKVVNDTSPTLILPQEDKEYMYLVMPIKT